MIREQDIEKIVRLVDGQLSPTEASELEAQIKANPELADEYRLQKSVSVLLQNVLKADPVPVPQSQKDYFSGIQAKIQKRNDEVKAVVAEKNKFWKRMAQARRIWAPAIAACVILSLTYVYEMGPQKVAAASGYFEVETGAGFSTTTLESDTICIEWIDSSYPDFSLGT